MDPFLPPQLAQEHLLGHVLGGLESPRYEEEYETITFYVSASSRENDTKKILYLGAPFFLLSEGWRRPRRHGIFSGFWAARDSRRHQVWSWLSEGKAHSVIFSSV